MPLKLLEIVHREEVKANEILSAKVEFLNSEKRIKISIQAPGYTTFFHTLRKDARKWRENRENLVSNLEIR